MVGHPRPVADVPVFLPTFIVGARVWPAAGGLRAGLFWAPLCDMAFPKGPPKPSSALTFWLAVAAAAVALLLLWGWQAGMLNQAGNFVKGLFSPAQFDSYKRAGGAEETSRAVQEADDARRRTEQERKAAEDRAAAERNEAEDQADVEKEAAQKAAEEKAAAEKAEADRLAAELAAIEEKARKEAEAAAGRGTEAGAQPDAGRKKPRLKRAPLNASEAAINREIARSFPLAQVRKYFNLQEQARRTVITVDNLSREHVPSQMRVARGVPGLLRVKKEGDTITLDEANYARYEPIIGYVEKLNVTKLARLYAKFYPLLQHTYENTGFPGERFQDRMLAAIDDMLAAPRVNGPIRLVQPKVLYRFESDKLENLSAGQKIMIRVGPENAARLRRVLARLRGAIAAQDPDLQDEP